MYEFTLRHIHSEFLKDQHHWLHRSNTPYLCNSVWMAHVDDVLDVLLRMICFPGVIGTTRRP